VGIQVKIRRTSFRSLAPAVQPFELPGSHEASRP
jgi:hypothetical protein